MGVRSWFFGGGMGIVRIAWVRPRETLEQDKSD